MVQKFITPIKPLGNYSVVTKIHFDILIVNSAQPAVCNFLGYVDFWFCLIAFEYNLRFFFDISGSVLTLGYFLKFLVLVSKIVLGY